MWVRVRQDWAAIRAFNTWRHHQHHSFSPEQLFPIPGLLIVLHTWLSPWACEHVCVAELTRHQDTPSHRGKRMALSRHSHTQNDTHTPAQPNSNLGNRFDMQINTRSPAVRSINCILKFTSARISIPNWCTLFSVSPIILFMLHRVSFIDGFCRQIAWPLFYSVCVPVCRIGVRIRN